MAPEPVVPFVMSDPHADAVATVESLGLGLFKRGSIHKGPSFETLRAPVTLAFSSLNLEKIEPIVAPPSPEPMRCGTPLGTRTISDEGSQARNQQKQLSARIVFNAAQRKVQESTSLKMLQAEALCTTALSLMRTFIDPMSCAAQKGLARAALQSLGMFKNGNDHAERIALDRMFAVGCEFHVGGGGRGQDFTCTYGPLLVSVLEGLISGGAASLGAPYQRAVKLVDATIVLWNLFLDFEDCAVRKHALAFFRLVEFDVKARTGKECCGKSGWIGDLIRTLDD
eukprot:comp22294_c0_seq1/m.33061 comp22294_c0_seq1/g.33061  ORF comp22294_c0_seq1/g.33061 comp22294_c0_seq1/m.33061 type:complete len:283 (-) comp22294_c0_seq1:563-1411(-)